MLPQLTVHHLQKPEAPEPEPESEPEPELEPELELDPEHEFEPAARARSPSPQLVTIAPEILTRLSSAMGRDAERQLQTVDEQLHGLGGMHQETAKRLRWLEETVGTNEGRGTGGAAHGERLRQLQAEIEQAEQAQKQLDNARIEQSQSPPGTWDKPIAEMQREIVELRGRIDKLRRD